MDLCLFTCALHVDLIFASIYISCVIELLRNSVSFGTGTHSVANKQDLLSTSNSS